MKVKHLISTKMNNKINKSEYLAPIIIRIELDNDITLQLESAPPVGPSEGINRNASPEYFNTDSFKSSLG